MKETKKSRSYLYGKLLATVEDIEKSTIHDDTYQPCTIQFLGHFIQHPLTAANNFILQTKRNSYYQLSPAATEFYEKMIGEIIVELDNFPANEINAPLDGSYLLGFYAQKDKINIDKENNKEIFAKER